VLDAGASSAILTSDLPSLHSDSVTVVIDPVGGDPRIESFKLLAPFGRYVLVGNASGRDSTTTLDAVWHRSITITGVSLGGIAHLRPRLAAESARNALNMLQKDNYRVATRPIEEIVSLHKELENGKAATKTVIKIR